MESADVGIYFMENGQEVVILGVLSKWVTENVNFRGNVYNVLLFYFLFHFFWGGGGGVS